MIDDLFKAKGWDGASVNPYPALARQTFSPIQQKSVPDEGVRVSDIVVHYQLERSIDFLPGDRLALSADGTLVIHMDAAGNVKGSTPYTVTRTMLPEK